MTGATCAPFLPCCLLSLLAFASPSCESRTHNPVNFEAWQVRPLFLIPPTFVGSRRAKLVFLIPPTFVGRVAHREQRERCDGWGLFHAGSTPPGASRHPRASFARLDP